jgi:hypothetical protein
MRIPPIALEDIVHRRDPPGLVLRARRDDGDLPARPAEVVIRSGRQAAVGGLWAGDRYLTTKLFYAGFDAPARRLNRLFQAQAADDLLENRIALRLRCELRGNVDPPIFLQVGALKTPQA